MPYSSNENLLTTLKQGGVVAYPTEAVFGLGCDPFCETAVQRIRRMKRRGDDMGLIIIASDWQQIASWVKPVDAARKLQIDATWPGHTTWVFAATEYAPERCVFDGTIAIRITAHLPARALCELFGGGIVSTSANRHGEPPLRDVDAVRACFGDEIDAYVEDSVGTESQPSQIFSAINGERLR